MLNFVLIIISAFWSRHILLPTHYCTISQARLKMKLLLTSVLLCLFLLPQHGCEAATVCSDLDLCMHVCSKTHCAVDEHTRLGCNQMFSCAQACKMRDLGLSVGQCWLQCQRNGQSGCSPTVLGWQFNLCVECNRAGPGCSKYPSVEECQDGCDFY